MGAVATGALTGSSFAVVPAPITLPGAEFVARACTAETTAARRATSLAGSSSGYASASLATSGGKRSGGSAALPLATRPWMY